MANLVFPDFNKSLVNIPSTILSHFDLNPLKKPLPKEFIKDLEGVEKIILFVFDGFGHQLYQKESIKHAFFNNLIKKGFYSKITSVFPSTTAAALTTLNSGLSPLEHGLPEWNIYFQELDCIVQTLPFLPLMPEDITKLINPPEGILFNQKTIYQYLGEGGIPSFIFLHNSYATSLYNKTASLGSTTLSYRGLADYVVMLRRLLKEVSGKAYFYAYWSGIDSYEHMFGPDSEEVSAEILLLSHLIQTELINKVDSKIAEKVGIILTSDHGQIATDLQVTTYLDQIPELKNYFKESPQGKTILPSGSPRDIFLHIKEEKLNYVLSLLKEKLKEKALVFKMEEFIKKGVFGKGKPHPEIYSRLGNLLILPEGNNTIWYRFLPEHRLEFNGLHGGLSEEEMLIPFTCAKLSQLKG